MLRFIAPLLILSIGGNILLLAPSRGPSPASAVDAPPRPAPNITVARAGVPRLLPVQQGFLPASGGGAPPAAGCGPAAQALAAQIQRARKELDRVLPAKLLFAAGTIDPRVTQTFQGTIEKIVGTRAATIKGHNFDCTERACRLSVLTDGQDQTWLMDLRVALARTHQNMPLLMISTANNIVERPDQSPLTQIDTFFKVEPVDQMVGEEAEKARQVMRDILITNSKMAGEVP
jgi:hypothetical protein